MSLFREEKGNGSSKSNYVVRRSSSPNEKEAKVLRTCNSISLIQSTVGAIAGAAFVGAAARVTKSQTKGFWGPVYVVGSLVGVWYGNTFAQKACARQLASMKDSPIGAQFRAQWGNHEYAENDEKLLAQLKGTPASESGDEWPQDSAPLSSPLSQTSPTRPPPPPPLSTTSAPSDPPAPQKPAAKPQKEGGRTYEEIRNSKSRRGAAPAVEKVDADSPVDPFALPAPLPFDAGEAKQGKKETKGKKDATEGGFISYEDLRKKHRQESYPSGYHEEK